MEEKKEMLLLGKELLPERELLLEKVLFSVQIFYTFCFHKTETVYQQQKLQLYTKQQKEQQQTGQQQTKQQQTGQQQTGQQQIKQQQTKQQQKEKYQTRQQQKYQIGQQQKRQQKKEQTGQQKKEQIGEQKKEQIGEQKRQYKEQKQSLVELFPAALYDIEYRQLSITLFCTYPDDFVYNKIQLMRRLFPIYSSIIIDYPQPDIKETLCGGPYYRVCVLNTDCQSHTILKECNSITVSVKRLPLNKNCKDDNSGEKTLLIATFQFQEKE